MKHKLLILCAVLFMGSILLFYGIGAGLRDWISPNVEVMSPTLYTFSDGQTVMAGLSSSCFHTEGSETYVYLAEQREDTGEKAYFAKRIAVTAGKSDGRCTELAQSPQFNAMYICSSDKEFREGDRVVITRILNTP